MKERVRALNERIDYMYTVLDNSEDKTLNASLMKHIEELEAEVIAIMGNWNQEESLYFNV